MYSLRMIFQLYTNFTNKEFYNFQNLYNYYTMNNGNYLVQDRSDLWRKAYKQIQKLTPKPQTYVVKSESSNLNKVSGIPANIQTFFDASHIPGFLNRLPKHSIRQQTSSNVPKSIKFLDKYAQMAGFKSMGQILQKQGSKYIGRVQEKDKNGEIYFRQFPQIQSRQYFSPDLYANFTSYCNEAIIKWNQFTESQAKLGTYISKISTKQGRQQLMKMYTSLANLGSTVLKMISSVSFCYLSERSTNKNFLQFPSQAIEVFKRILKTNGRVIAKGAQIVEFCNLYAPQKKAKFIRQFVYNQQMQIRALLRQQQFELIQETLEDQTVYVPPQMIVVPENKTPQWYKYLTEKKQNNLLNLTILPQWNYRNPMIKFINFF